MEVLLARANYMAQMSPIDEKLWNALQDDVLAYPDVDALMEFAASQRDARAAMVLMTMIED